MRDLVKLLAFHDEREIKGKWLYHGFILSEIDKCPVIINDLVNEKNGAQCPIGDRIHFKEFSSKSTGSASVRTAVKWVLLFRDMLHIESYTNMRFYFFGINLSNINYDSFGSPSNGQNRHFRIYNKFFEIGLFAACRWFFNPDTTDIEIERILSEKRSPREHDPFIFYAPYKINQRESNIKVMTSHITQVKSTPSEEVYYPDYVHVVNFADVLVGAFSQAFDFSSRGKKGCIEVAEKVCGVCERLSTNPHNRNSKYYKKYALSFFPKQKLGTSYLLATRSGQLENQFYFKRPITLSQPRLF